VAYLVATPDATTPDTPTLREFLHHTLPDYMIPAAFIEIDHLPLNATGKIDRRALPAPDFTAAVSGGYVAPRTDTEQVLADIWAQVLGVDRSGSKTTSSNWVGTPS
jgi:hypothetical protein